MTTALITHPDCLNHITPQGHPERVARLEAILQTLDDPAFADLQRHQAPLVSREALLRAHPAAHIEAIAAAAPDDGGWRSLDADTHMSPGSLAAAQRGAGGNVAAVDLVLSGAADNVFVAVRPPGHHAEKQTAMGFCLFGNVVVAAKHALAQDGISRVAIIDFDVHHGNGTQDLVWDDPNILFVSTHQMPLYPGSGARSERGAHDNIVNIPLDAHTNGATYRTLFDAEVIPAVEGFAPDMIFISAGFDAHTADPLANIDLSADDFAHVTERLCDVADEHCNGRVVSTLEGGYDLAGLAASTAAHVKVLMERGA